MTNPTRRCSSRQSHLFSVTAVDAVLQVWAAARGYELPVVELVGDGMPGEVVLCLRDDAGVEQSLLFVLADGQLRVSDFSVPQREAAEIDAEVRRWWLA